MKDKLKNEDIQLKINHDELNLINIDNDDSSEVSEIEIIQPEKFDKSFSSI